MSIGFLVTAHKLTRQRAYRDRSRIHLENLERQIKALDGEQASLESEGKRLKQMLQEATLETSVLKAMVSTLSEERQNRQPQQHQLQKSPNGFAGMQLARTPSQLTEKMNGAPQCIVQINFNDFMRLLQDRAQRCREPVKRSFEDLFTRSKED